MAKYFIEKGKVPLLLVDIDPDQSLGEAVGVSLEEAGKKSISELVIETFIEGTGTTIGIPPSERIESKIWEQGLYEGEDFDFMAIGPKWVEGCYCLPDASLKRALERLTKVYSYVLIDSPAGLEHLNRKITSQVDDLIRARRIVEEVQIEYKDFFVVGGYRFSESLEPMVHEKTGLKYLGKIPYDKTLEEYFFSGRPLLEPADLFLNFHIHRQLIKG